MISPCVNKHGSPHQPVSANTESEIPKCKKKKFKFVLCHILFSSMDEAYDFKNDERVKLFKLSFMSSQPIYRTWTLVTKSLVRIFYCGHIYNTYNQGLTVIYVSDTIINNFDIWKEVVVKIDKLSI